MSAHTIFECAPLGALVVWSDGTPRPPARHRRNLDASKTSNSQGRLIRKQDPSGAGLLDPHASFTLREADYGAGGVVAIRVHRTFSLASSLSFDIVERSAAGSVREFDNGGDDAELVVLAPNRAAAEYGYPNAVLEDVSADEAAADSVEGRAPA